MKSAVRRQGVKETCEKPLRSMNPESNSAARDSTTSSTDIICVPQGRNPSQHYCAGPALTSIRPASITHIVPCGGCAQLLMTLCICFDYFPGPSISPLYVSPRRSLGNRFFHSP